MLRPCFLRRRFCDIDEEETVKEYLTIGEIAQIFQMDVQLLRHYDARGLLVPALRNEENGRRLYRFDQVYPLATIRYLRKLGYSLNRIGEFVQNGNVDKNLETLVDQAALLRQQCAELMETVDIIQKKLDFVARESRDAGRDVYRVKTYPDRPFIRIGHYLNLYTHELYYFYPVVGFYQQGEKWFGAYLFDERASAASAEKGVEPDWIPGGRYFCGYHCGPYRTIQESIDRLYEAGASYRLDQRVVTLNIIDQFVEGHPTNFITSLEARILEPPRGPEKIHRRRSDADGKPEGT